MTKTIEVKTRIPMDNGITERGTAIPIAMHTWLTSKPINIKVKRLRPKDNKKVFRIPNSLSLKALRTANPGINDR
jgi:hypothetical protein